MVMMMLNTFLRLVLACAASCLLLSTSVVVVTALPDGSPACTEGVAVASLHTSRKFLVFAVLALLVTAWIFRRIARSLRATG